MTKAKTSTQVKQNKTSVASLFGHYLKGQRAKAGVMAVLLLVAIGLQLVGPQILRVFIDTAVGGEEAVSRLTQLALVYLAIAVVKQLFNATATYLGADVGWTATNLIRRDLARHTFGLDMAFHNSRTAGEMIERIDGDVTALSNFFSQFAVRVFGAALLLVGVLVLLWLENTLVGLALTLFAAAEIAVLTRTRQLAVPATRQEREASARLYGFIEERLAGIEDIRANGGGAHALHRFTATMHDYFTRARRSWVLRSSIWLSSYALFVVGLGATLAAAIWLVTRGQVTVGTGYLIMQYMFLLQNPIEQITQQMQDLQKALASVGRVQDLLAIESDLPQGQQLDVPVGALEVVFDSVDFAYNDKPILKDVSFRLTPGSTLGLLGRTGSGKSTLTRLLFRFYDPAAGKVALSGVDLRDAELTRLHSRVGMVTQEVQLFQASLRDNLRFFDDTVTDERVREVLAKMGLTDWLAGLPQGLDTELTAGGQNLSAGEAQLLAFARVFLKDPGLVILDEPSSRLDPATEKRLDRAVENLLRGRTAIIIAHRLDTVARADEIMILRDGEIAEHGRRTRLLEDKTSEFSQLLAAGKGLDDEDINEVVQ